MVGAEEDVLAFADPEQNITSTAHTRALRPLRAARPLVVNDPQWVKVMKEFYDPLYRAIPIYFNRLPPIDAYS